jgi:hypothetical protein
MRSIPKIDEQMVNCNVHGHMAQQREEMNCHEGGDRISRKTKDEDYTCNCGDA